MKKVVLVFAAIAGIGFAACNSSTSEQNTSLSDSVKSATEQQANEMKESATATADSAKAAAEQTEDSTKQAAKALEKAGEKKAEEIKK